MAVMFYNFTPTNSWMSVPLAFADRMAGRTAGREYTALIDPPYKISSKAALLKLPIPAPEPVVPELAMQPPALLSRR
jgi:hypothetical protein